MKRLEWDLADPADVGMADVEAMAGEAVEAGCVRLGRIVFRPDGDADRWEKHLASGPREEWHDVLVAPVHLMATADATAAVEVAPFWRVVAVRALTPLADRSLVETSLAWSETPPWPGNLQHTHKRAKLEEEMLRNDAPGRSVRWVPRGGIPDLLRAHEAHVAEVAATRDTAMVPVTDFDEAIGLLEQCFAHSRAVGRRVSMAIYSSAWAIELVALALCLWAGLAIWWVVLGAFWGALLAWVLTPSWFVTFSYTRWFRPSFPAG